MSTQPTPESPESALRAFHWYDQCVATLRGHVANTRTSDWVTVQAFDATHVMYREQLKRAIAMENTQEQTNAHLIAYLTDAALQLARLTGPDLLTYSRTFAVLARNAIAKATAK